MPIDRTFVAEKPSLAQGIAEALAELTGNKATRGDGAWTVGDDRVTWLFGHMYETAEPKKLDPKWEKWNLDSLPIVVEASKWRLNPLDKHKGHLAKIRDLLKQSKAVVNCGDAAREGQLLVDEVIIESGLSPFDAKVQRLWVKSMARKDMIAAISGMKPNLERKSLYESAVCRQRADFQHGMTWTRFMTVKARSAGFDTMLSVGRVQTPTLRLVVDRDRERAAFKPVDHYLPRVVFRHANGEFKTTWIVPTDFDGLDPEGRLIDRKVADSILSGVNGTDGKVVFYKAEGKSTGAPLPFSLSALQADCAAKFGLTAAETLEVAQALYETHKATTYPRSDSRHLPTSIFKDEAPQILRAVSAVPELMEAAKGADPSMRSSAWDDSKVSDHHGIIPTTEFSAAKLDRMSDRERQVCMLIVRTFLAQFLPLFRYKATTVEVACSDHRFRALGRLVTDQGWKRAFGAGEADDEDDKDEEAAQSIPQMGQGDPVKAIGGDVASKRTSAPPAFNDGTLITAMANIHRFVTDAEAKRKLKENAGIGTEATRAATLTTIIDRGYVKRKGKTGLESTDLGKSLIDSLPPYLSDPVLTALWEGALEDVEKGKRTLSEFMEAQAKDLTARVGQMRSVPITIKGVKPAVKPVDGHGETCAKCGKGTMVTKVVHKDGPSKGKVYLACSEYPDCDNRVWPGEKVAPVEGHGKDCPACGKGKLETKKITKEGKTYIFLSCTNYPDCRHREWPAPPALPGTGETCPKCSKTKLVTRVVQKDGPSKGKSFLSCPDRECGFSKWPEEKVANPLPGDGAKCTKCGVGTMDTKTIRKEGPNQGKKFLSCTNYPACNNAVWPDRDAGGGGGKPSFSKDSKRPARSGR